MTTIAHCIPALFCYLGGANLLFLSMGEPTTGPYPIRCFPGWLVGGGMVTYGTFNLTLWVLDLTLWVVRSIIT